LADELGELYDDDDDEEVAEGEFGDELEGLMDESNIGMAVDHDGSAGAGSAVNVNGVRDSGVAMPSSSPSAQSGDRLSPQNVAKVRRHARQRSLYDGSDYGDDSDLESNEGISPGLESRMAAIESLARRGIEENGSLNDGVVKRVADQLKDLGSQSGIENGATRYALSTFGLKVHPSSHSYRLKTAHDALTTHLTHQSRTFTSLTASFSGPRAVIPDPESIEALLPLITSTLESLPHSSPQPVIALSQLSTSTRELLELLSNISDSLHMSRQATTNASRRIKSAKEQLGEWKRDMDAKDAGVAWIEDGNWDSRLKEREAGSACRDVVSGFEEMFGQYRQRLCEGLGVASA
jgi:hypothetical protein